MEMLRRIASGRKVSDASHEPQRVVDPRHDAVVIGSSAAAYLPITLSPEQMDAQERHEAACAAAREGRQKEIARNTAIGDSITAAAKKLWRRA
ncbi:hypothetical protein CCR94_01985 [Rhodoblastus sphagnicola]|uniref:Uncharacterized protein n=1 Tax=Rhodoblastus sphagnicola TaxID=333368 RepID=A0A2S6NFJ3_9HYPH|nr:hypothetical protein [Rhodoblastus sphagnicola]MBB4199199.1 hypothetical protein [Rhodoblastus sphagnicola]PPQ33391.1 hypothetical protein CCR94_01985 [Rhodoblastus sphagnicola]